MTVANELHRRGVLSATTARWSPSRHALAQSVGSDDPIHVETTVIDLFPGDRLILCSDGLGEYLDRDRTAILAGLRRQSPERTAAMLVNYANDCGGEDTITVVIIDVGGGDQA